MDAYRTVVALHVLAGTVALAAFWTAGFSRKGGLLHRGAGKAYLLAMVAVLATAVVVTGQFFASGRTLLGVFLGYLVVITSVGCWTAWRAIRDRRDPARFFGPLHRALAWLSIASGLATFAAGVAMGAVLLMTFCWIGVAGGATMLRKSREAATIGPRGGARWWMREHYVAMLGNGVATHIAFLGIGASRLLQPLGLQVPQLMVWLTPVAVALAAGVWLDRKYGLAQARPRSAGTDGAKAQA